MSLSGSAKLGMAILTATAISSALIGGCAANSMRESATQEALERLRGTGNVPSASEEAAMGFQPSDSPPRCLPSGTVTYEAYDSAANVRYWVFRWPEDKGYSIVPRLTLDDSGQLVPYEPPAFTMAEVQE